MGGDQDPLPASYHDSTGSRIEISGTPRDSPFQGSATADNWDFDYTFPELNCPQGTFDHGAGLGCDDQAEFDDGGLLQPCMLKPEEDHQKPQMGMMFSSWVEAEEFFKEYAKKTGFTVRRGKTYKQQNGTLKWRRFLCSCEGFRANRPSNQGTKYQRLETRTGCEAQMQVTFEKEKWVITNLLLNHNHCLNNSNQSLEKVGELLDKVENQRDHPQQTPEVPHAVTSSPWKWGRAESSAMAKPSGEVEASCGDQLSMEVGSLLVAGSASLPIPTPTLSGASMDKGKQSTNLGGVNNTVPQLAHAGETIWQQILTKYGDITAKCTLKSRRSMAYVKESVLEIVELLRNKTVHDLSDEDISTMDRTLSDLESVGVKVDWLRSRFVEVGNLFHHVKTKDRMEKTRRRIVQLERALDLWQTKYIELQRMVQGQIPAWFTIEATLDTGLLLEERDIPE